MMFGGVVPGQKFTMDKHIHCRTKFEKGQRGLGQFRLAYTHTGTQTHTDILSLSIPFFLPFPRYVTLAMCTYVRMYVCVHRWLSRYAGRKVCMYACMYTCIKVSMYVRYPCMCVHVHLYTCERSHQAATVHSDAFVAICRVCILSVASKMPPETVIRRK